MKRRIEGYDPSWMCVTDGDGYVEHLWAENARAGDLCWCKKEPYPYSRRPPISLSRIISKCEYKTPRRANAREWSCGYWETIDFDLLSPFQEVLWFLDAWPLDELEK